MNRALLSLGSNLGDREGHLREALRLISEHGQIAVRRVSSLYETAPVGLDEALEFLNLVVEVETDLSPRELLLAAQEVEAALGRPSPPRSGSRTMDVDLLTYGEVVLDEPGLILPHPRMFERRFVLEPLAELEPELRIGGGTVTELLADVRDQEVRLRRSWD